MLSDLVQHLTFGCSLAEKFIRQPEGSRTEAHSSVNWTDKVRLQTLEENLMNYQVGQMNLELAYLLFLLVGLGLKLKRYIPLEDVMRQGDENDSV